MPRPPRKTTLISLELQCVNISIIINIYYCRSVSLDCRISVYVIITESGQIIILFKCCSCRSSICPSAVCAGHRNSACIIVSVISELAIGHVVFPVSNDFLLPENYSVICITRLPLSVKYSILGYWCAEVKLTCIVFICIPSQESVTSPRRIFRRFNSSAFIRKDWTCITCSRNSFSIIEAIMEIDPAAFFYDRIQLNSAVSIVHRIESCCGTFFCVPSNVILLSPLRNDSEREINCVSTLSSKGLNHVIILIVEYSICRISESRCYSYIS